MKIGIISINAYTKGLNFASPIHSFVFQQFLKEHGIDSTIIDYKPNYYGKFDLRHPLFYYIDHPSKEHPEEENFNEYLLQRWKTLFYEREIRYEKFENFMNKYYKKTDRCYSARIMDKVDAGFDCYMCVTDVIWKCAGKTGFDKGFFLACKTMEGKKKIAYAASRGPVINEYTPQQKADFFKYIGDFDAISVREKSLKDYLMDEAGMDVPQVIDPVFLEDKEFYEKLAIRPERKKGFVLIYIVMERNHAIVQEAVKFAEAHDLEVVELSELIEHAHIPKDTYHDVIYDIGIEEWLGYMLEAEYIFTNSFHACCFSIIFEQQFIAGGRNGDKIDSLLETFGLEWRRVKGDQKGRSLELKDIDFSEVRPEVARLVKISEEYVLNAIREAQEDFDKERKGEHENRDNLS